MDEPHQNIFAKIQAQEEAKVARAAFLEERKAAAKVAQKLNVGFRKIRIDAARCSAKLGPIIHEITAGCKKIKAKPIVVQQEWQQSKEVMRDPSRKALAGKHFAAATSQINKLLARQSMEVPPSIDVLAIL